MLLLHVDTIEIDTTVPSVHKHINIFFEVRGIKSIVLQSVDEIISNNWLLSFVVDNIAYAEDLIHNYRLYKFLNWVAEF